MSTTLETAIVERLHRLDEQRQAEVLDFVEFLASRSKIASPAVAWPQIDPARDLAQTVGIVQKKPPTFDPMRYSGTVQWPMDGLAFQNAARMDWE